MDLELNNKIIFLTGGSRGIGYACAKAYKRNGAKIAIAALEKGQEPTPNTTKAIGCSIKVKK